MNIAPCDGSEQLPSCELDIVVCTCDRPESLNRLLHSILQQKTCHTFRISVVDNHPSAFLLEDLKPLFPGVRWIAEPRQGLSFARNAGIRLSSAEIIVFADDDLELLPGWLDSLVAPITLGRCDLVVGPVSPAHLATQAEQLFEAYGAHGHQHSYATYDRSWLRAQRWCLPLWQIGGIGNSAVRRSAQLQASADGFDEALGVGTPAGSFEDIYFLYLLLRTNARIVREPGARVLHTHRETLDGLSQQLANYRRGEVCFCLLVLLRHGDPRGLLHLCFFIPAWRTRLLLQELIRRAHGKVLFPFRLMVREFMSYLMGPAALVLSLRRASRLRREPPVVRDLSTTLD
jgi:glycosyltransferase involved in cell wall biosynthesis